MPKWIDAPQGSVEWLKSRIGVLTASRMVDVLDVKKNGEESEKRRKYKIALLAERMTDLAEENYVNGAMQWGIDHEAEARELYEEITGEFVQQCGLAMHDTIEYFGASPDGLIGHEGLIEIKCPTSSTHMAWLMAGVVPDQHKPQMLAQLACTCRKWCDFMTYDPRYPAPHNRMIVRFEPTQAEIAAIESAAESFLCEVELMWDQLCGLPNSCPPPANEVKRVAEDVCGVCGFKNGRHSPVCNNG